MGDMVVADVKERPILFSGEMVRAILDGRKTQTRRIIKPQPEAGLRFVVERPAVGGSVAHFGYVDVGGVHHKELTVTCRHGQPSDRLWVRETWMQTTTAMLKPGPYLYRADGWVATDANYHPWRPSMFMPREASRLTLEVVSVRVERVQEISGADVTAEGFGTDFLRHERFERLWDSINGKRAPWASNPWVWVVEFKRVTA